MKRFSVIIIVIIVLLTLLAVGCSKSNQTNSANSKGGQMNRLPQFDQEAIKTGLAGLVKDGTINQKQADAVADYLQKLNEERKNRMAARNGNQNQAPNSGQTPNPGQDPSWGQGQNRGQRPNQLSELVNNGTITQEQADKITDTVLRPKNTQQNNSGI